MESGKNLNLSREKSAVDPEGISQSLTALSPLDGRYARQLAPLREYFSEHALIRERCRVELGWYNRLLSMGIFDENSSEAQHKIDAFLQAYSQQTSLAIKMVELEARHDVKAMEYYLARTAGLAHPQFLHFGLTSEDVSCLAYGLMLQGYRNQLLLPQLSELVTLLAELADAWSDIPLLARTHGQPATPTTFGKEIAVYALRLAELHAALAKHQFTGKLAGATGNYAALNLAYPAVNWPEVADSFISDFGLLPTLLCTQIDTEDALAAFAHLCCRLCTVQIDLARDLWLYCSRNLLKPLNREGEVGSSTMPHKVNPIDFENAEGNAVLSRSLFSTLADSLPNSRLQRDLSGSTQKRNLGTAAGYMHLSLQAMQTGLARVSIDTAETARELEIHREVLAEACQTILRKEGHANAYDLLKGATKGRSLDSASYQQLLAALPLTKASKEQLRRLTPADYIGLSPTLARRAAARARHLIGV